jgi:hypothetical protein
MTTQILRWTFFIPLAVGIYLVSKICFSWTFYFISSKVMEDITSASDYGGHYILGPLFRFIGEGFAVGFAVYSGVYLAPKQKKIVYFIFVGIWILFMLFASFMIGLTYFKIEWTGEKLFRTLTEIVAQIVGFIVAGIFIWKEIKKQNDLYYIDYEFLKTNKYE